MIAQSSLSLDTPFMLKYDALGNIYFGGIAPFDDDSAMYFSLYHIATGASNDCTMIYGKISVSSGATSLDWQF